MAIIPRLSTHSKERTEQSLDIRKRRTGAGTGWGLS